MNTINFNREFSTIGYKLEGFRRLDKKEREKLIGEIFFEIKTSKKIKVSIYKEDGSQKSPPDLICQLNEKTIPIQVTEFYATNEHSPFNNRWARGLLRQKLNTEIKKRKIIAPKPLRLLLSFDGKQKKLTKPLISQIVPRVMNSLQQKINDHCCGNNCNKTMKVDNSIHREYFDILMLSATGVYKKSKKHSEQLFFECLDGIHCELECLDGIPSGDVNIIDGIERLYKNKCEDKISELLIIFCYNASMLPFHSMNYVPIMQKKWKSLNFKGIYFLELMSIINEEDEDEGTMYYINMIKEHPVFINNKIVTAKR